MVLVGVALVVAVACGGGGSDGADHNPGELFPDRANQYREDQEHAIGDATRRDALSVGRVRRRPPPWRR